MNLYLRIVAVCIVTFFLGFVGYLSLINDLGYRKLRANVASGSLGNQVERYGTVTAIDLVSKVLTFSSLDPAAPNEATQSLTIDAGGATVVEQYLSTTIDGYSGISGATVSTFSDISVGSHIHVFLRPTGVLTADTIFFGDPL